MEHLELKAYEIFFNELRKQLDFARDALKANLEIDKSQQELLRVAFHNIKGGSGFFKLLKLQSCAARLEKLVKETPNEFLNSILEGYRENYEELEVLISQMPLPKEEEGI